MSVAKLESKRMTKVSSKKTSPDSPFQLSVTTVEEQGILESFFKLPQLERRIIRKLLEKCGPQQVGVIRLPVPFGPKEYKERRNFLSPVYKLMRYHRLTFDSIANGALRWTYLPWIESITHVKAGEELGRSKKCGTELYKPPNVKVFDKVRDFCGKTRNTCRTSHEGSLYSRNCSGRP